MQIKIPSEIFPTEKGFLFDPYTGYTYTLNSTAIFIFRKLQEGINISEIAKFLANEYKIDDKKVLDDIKDFIQQLKDFSLEKS